MSVETTSEALIAAFDDLHVERFRPGLVALEVEIDDKRRLDRRGNLVERPVLELLRQIHPILVAVQAGLAEIDRLEAELEGGRVRLQAGNRRASASTNCGSATIESASLPLVCQVWKSMSVNSGGPAVLQ